MFVIITIVVPGICSLHVHNIEIYAPLRPINFCQSVGIDLVVYVAVGAAGRIVVLFIIILILCSS